MSSPSSSSSPLSSLPPSATVVALSQTPPLNAYAEWSREWVAPGTIAMTAVGSAVGASLSGWYNRPMWTSTLNVGLKFGVCGLTYLANMSLLSNRVDPEKFPRPLVHATSGLASGGLIGLLTQRGSGAVRGSMVGMIASIPVWFIMEGRHKFKQQDQKTETTSQAPLITIRKA